MLTFYRYEPVPIVKDPSYFLKFPLETDPCPFDNEDWETAILHMFGSGKYGCYINESNHPPDEGSNTACKCFQIKTRWDLENYPPVMDPADVDLDEPTNQSYIQWLTARGLRKIPQQDDTSDMAVNEKLVEALIGQNQRNSTPVPPPPYRESPLEKLTLVGADAVIGMVKKQAESMTTAQTTQSDPLAILQGYATFASTMTAGSKGTELMIDSLSRRLEAAEERSAKLMDRLLDARTAPSAAAAQPKTLLDQMREMREMKELMGEFMGGGSSAESKDSGGSMKEMFIQNLPAILTGGLAIVDRVITGATAITAVSKGQPIPEAPKPAEVQAPPQPQPQPITVPAGMTEAQVRQYHQMLMVVAKPLLDHFKRAVANNTEPPENGYTFAQWFIDGYGEVPAYTSIAVTCKNGEGRVDVEPLIAIIKTFPPIWNEVSTVETEFRQFITEFVTIKDLPPEGEEEGQVQ